MRPTLLRILVWILANGILAPLAMVVCLAAGYEWQTGGVVAGAVALLAWPCIAPAVPRHLDASDGRGRLLFVAFVVLGLLACLRTVGTGTFMLDATDKTWAIQGVDGFGGKHNCFTCMVVGAHLARQQAPNIYDKASYRATNEADRTPVHRTIGKTLTIDSLPYPPPALLIPQAMQAGGHDFFQVRSYWYAFTLFLLVAGLAASATFAGGFGANRSLLLFPGLLLVPTVVVTLQIGNVQTVVVACSVLAMLAFARRWDGVGAALLGYAILTKLWPAILLAYLVLGGRWRPVLHTLVAMVLYCLATLAAFGTQPFVAFLQFQLPQLLSGEAFAFMRTSPHAMMVNMSVFGWPHKLHALGLGAPHSLLPGTLKWTYTGFLAVVVLIAGLRQAGRDRERPLHAVRTWLAILTLVQLRSPFLPSNYGVLSTLWLLVFLLPGAGRLRAIVTVLALALVAIDIPVFAEARPMTVHMWLVLVISAVAFLASVAALLPVLFGRRSRAADTGTGRFGVMPPGE